MELSSVDSWGNYVGRNEEEVRAFYRWFDGGRDNQRGVGSTRQVGTVFNAERNEGTQETAGVWTSIRGIRAYRRGSEGLRLSTDQGRSRVFYHGTGEIFDRVQIDYPGKDDSRYLGHGFYITSNKNHASLVISEASLSGRRQTLPLPGGQNIASLN